MTGLEFIKKCNNHKFSSEELKTYGNFEIKLMSLYLAQMRSQGDTRSKNEILIEWIKIYSEQFRIMWVMLIDQEGCNFDAA